jgi:hypothetical protein
MTEATTLPTAPAFYAHKGDHYLRSGEGFGATCARCHRAVSAPHKFQGAVIWCIYCGFEVRHVPEVEVPFGLENEFGITAEECRLIRDTLAKGGDVHAVLEARSDRLGQLVRFF